MSSQTEQKPAADSKTGGAQDILTSHEYDGIREYDNPTPGWWNWLFIGTIVFSIGYFFIFVVSGGAFSPTAEYDRAAAAELELMFASKPLPSDAATLMRLNKNPAMHAMGEGIFATKCASCHGRDGSGLIGPNLTDDFYINIRRIEDIPDFIAKGKVAVGMPAWGTQLKPNEIVVISSYVASLRGQNKPGKPKEFNAIQIPPWSETSTPAVAVTTPDPTTTDDNPANKPATLKRDAQSLLAYMKDPAMVDAGSKIFANTCIACHGPEGSGKGALIPVPGPNLTDDFYLNIKKIEDLPAFISKGSDPTKPLAEGAVPMPAWGQVLSPDDITRVAVYVATLRGQNKPGTPVEPTAVKIPPWSE